MRFQSPGPNEQQDIVERVCQLAAQRIGRLAVVTPGRHSQVEHTALGEERPIGGIRQYRLPVRRSPMPTIPPQQTRIPKAHAFASVSSRS